MRRGSITRRGGLAHLIAICLAVAAAIAAAIAVVGRNGGAGDGDVEILPEPLPSPAGEAPRCPSSEPAADEAGCKAAWLEAPAKLQARLTPVVTADVGGQ